MLRPVLLAFALLVVLTSSALARAGLSERVRAQRFPAPPIRARAGIVVDATSGAVLAAVNPRRRLPMASTTKIMTALVAIERGKLSDRITVPKAAFDYEADATVMGLKPGEKVTLQDLLYGLLLPSGADAANTIAIHYGGSEARFATLMNAEARRLGMLDTHYVNAHGLTSTNHYTTAYDLALLARYVSTIPTLMRIVGTKSYTWNGRTLTNLNRPLFWYPGVDGIKPGYTDDAGLCQVLDAQRHGRHVIAVLLNTPDLVLDARNYLNYGLRDYTWVQSALAGDSPSLVQTGTDALGPYTYFPASGHYVRGTFLRAFVAYGGAPTMGFPRTEPLTEGSRTVQYFQNGAIALDPISGTYRRIPLGLTPIPSITTTPKPSPTPTARPMRTPGEGTVVVPTGTPTPQTGATGRATAGPTGTGTAAPRRTPTRTPVLRPTPTRTPVLRPTVASVFTRFVKAHTAFLGAPVGTAYRVGIRTVQLFRFGALDYNAQTRFVALLPIGDRSLAHRGFLPRYAGNTYPPGFASSDILRLIGWLPPRPAVQRP